MAKGRTRVIGRELRRHVVRVGRPEDGSLLGTGFFVAPGWVLTCAHVVAGLERVALVPDPALSEPVTATVEARSAPPVNGGLWPYPDLALLRLESRIDHPCVALDAAEPDNAEDCHAWGYPQQESDQADPPGAPATFRFEGRQDDGYFKLKSGQASPGLSGAPLLCPYRRAVVGVISATRDRHSDLGGWASPIAALFEGGPGVPGDLVTLGRRIREENRAAVLADRTSWHRVLPVDDYELLLARPWGPFIKQRRSSPADLLQADFGVVPYLFRDAGLAETVAWCETADEMALAIVVGQGGAGKTRFAIELCERMIGRSWAAGHWPDQAGAAQAQLVESIVDLPMPRLIVIDYAEAFPVRPLRVLLEQLRSRATSLAPVRVLLLVRASGNSLLDVLGQIGRGTLGQLRTVLDAAWQVDFPAEMLDHAQRRVLYTEAIDHFRRAWFIGPEAPPHLSPGVPDLSGEHFGLPLEVLFEAFDRALALDSPEPSGKPPIHRVLDHERKYWEATAPAGLDEAQRYQCAALATLIGAANEVEADALLVAAIPELAGDSARPLRRRTVTWLASLHSGPALFNPLRPDRLGEALVASLLIGDHSSGRDAEPWPFLDRVLMLPSHQQVASCLDLLARLSVYDSSVAKITINALAEVHTSLIVHAESQTRETQQQPAKMTVAGGIIRLLSGAMGRRLIDVSSTLPDALAELASSFIKIGDLARSSAQYSQAEPLYHYALHVHQRLLGQGGARPDNQTDPATVYVRLGELAEIIGDYPVAKDYFHKAVDTVNSVDPAELETREHRDLLFLCYSHLSNILQTEKKIRDAQDYSRLAVTIQKGVRLNDLGLESDSISPATPSVDSTRVGEADGPGTNDFLSRRHANRNGEAGEIVTFYSYKGGTGRTMALANIAWILAANGKQVLVTDWDLESPSLHRFFRPFLDPAAISATPGVIDLIREYQWATLSKEPKSLEYHLDYARVQKYAISLDWEFPGGGRLDFLSAGRQNRDYSQSVASINWDEFYAERGGGLYFDALREDMRCNYDYTLIDSRTGLSDVADICTVHLPDILVDCFTLTDQGIEGAAAIARSIAESYPDRGIRIFPVPMKVSGGENEKANAGRALARARFSGFPSGLDQTELAHFWSGVEVPFQPFYAFEETLAVFGDPPRLPGSILSAMEQLTGWITKGEVTALPPMNEAERLRVLRAFTRAGPPDLSDLLLAYVPEDRMWADWINAVLATASLTVTLVDVTNAWPTDPAEPTRHRTVAVVSPAFVRSHAAMDFAHAVAGTDPSGSRRRLVPVIVGKVSPVSSLTDRAAADLTGDNEASAIEALLGAMDYPGPAPTIARMADVRFPSSIPPVWNVQPRNASFTGRNSVLEHLRDQLATKAVSVVLPVALHGLGGVGKTQVALEYTHRFKADYDLVWWVDAEQHDQINRSLAELAPRLGIRVGESFADAAREAREKLRLGEPYNRWLLIFDNADDPADLRAFLPGGPGHVLITSRNQSWTQVADPLEVDVFARTESTDLLLRQVPTLSSAEAQELAEMLGDLPLAVEVAGAWLADSGQPVGEYIVSLKAEGSTGALFQSRPTNYPRSLEATWKISLDQLAARSQAALRLLELCAFFAPEISIELIYGPQTIEALLPLDGSLRVPMMFSRVIQEISRLSLVRVDRQSNSIQIHRLVQAYLRDQMDAEKTDSLVHEVHRILTAARPQRGDTDDPKNWPKYQLIWPHLTPSNAANCDEEPVRQLLIDRVRYLWKSGDFNRGLALALQLEDTWKAALAGETKTTSAEDRELLYRQLLHLQSQRANIYRSQGEIALAASLDREVLAEQRQALPPDDLHTLITAGGMAADLRLLGQFAKALEMDRATYKSLKQIYGEDHERTLVAANNLGVDFRLNGDCFTALDFDQDTLERRHAVLGAAHPYTLSSKLHVARDLRETGDFAQSVSVLRATYTEFIEVLDENYVETLRTATSLGTSLRYVGQHVQASAVTEETYARYEEEFNADTLDAYACRLNLGADLAATGEVPAAIDLIRTVHSDYSRRLGARHPFALVSLNNLAVYLGRDGHDAEALAVARQCVEALTEILGPDHRYTLTAQSTLATSHALVQEYQEAVTIDKYIHSRFIDLLREDHPTTLGAGLNLANSLEAIGKADQAHALRRHLLPMCVRRLGDDHPTTRAAREGGRVDHELEPQPM